MQMKTNFTKIIFISCLSVAVSCTSNKTSDNNNFQKNKPDTSVVSETESPDSELEVLDGWLKCKTNQQTIINKLGLPEKKNKEVYLGASGTYAQTWSYPTLGIVLVMESDDKASEKNVRTIIISKPCKLTTSQGIGINSDSKLVSEIYCKLIDSTQSDSNYIVVGTIYGGTIFNLKNNLVNSIFIGAYAE